MSANSIEQLNARFAIAKHLSFKAGSGGLPMVAIHNAHAAAEIYLLGGHVASFQPHGQAPVLWMSEKSWFEAGKPIRGGIPICLPWFGAHPQDANLPAHGFVRLANWNFLESRALPGGETLVRLGLTDQDTAHPGWQYAYQFELVVTVGQDLQVELIVRNPGKAAFTCTGALHTYFNVGDIHQTRVQGLDGCDYLDKVEGFVRKTQQGAVTFQAETDRVYVDTTAECQIEDAALKRRISIQKKGSHTTVVWNPWIEKSIRMPDFGDEEYKRMVCVETANAAQDVVRVEPGKEHHLYARIGTAAL